MRLKQKRERTKIRKCEREDRLGTHLPHISASIMLGFLSFFSESCSVHLQEVSSIIHGADFFLGASLDPGHPLTVCTVYTPKKETLGWTGILLVGATFLDSQPWPTLRPACLCPMLSSQGGCIPALPLQKTLLSPLDLV